VNVSVLVVDDDKLTRWSFATLLGRLGYRVREAASGSECLAAMRAEAPDLVLLDIVLPDLDGFRILSEIRAQYPQVPVILMTANPARDTRARARAAGAAEYLEKPCDPAVLEAALARVRLPR
jgi:CheY-like chemotaxis protein